VDRYPDGQFSPKILFSYIIINNELYIRAPLLAIPNISEFGGWGFYVHKSLLKQKNEFMFQTASVEHNATSFQKLLTIMIVF
jgi:hypothetical protein